MDNQTSRLPADLSHAPHDVKLWLVDLIKARSRETLIALRGVSKEWQALVDPHLWSHIHLEPAQLEDLKRFILDCVVHIGPHVRTLSIREWVHSTEYQPSGNHGVDSWVRGRLAAIEQVLGLPAAPVIGWPFGTWGQRIATAQNALLARAVEACTALEALKITGSVAVVTHEHEGGFDGGFYDGFDDGYDVILLVPENRVPNRVFPAIQKIAHSIRELSLTMGPDFVDDAAVEQMTRLVALTPQCRRLTLKMHGKVPKRWNDENRKQLMSTIASLKQLEAFTTNGFTKWDRILDDKTLSLPSTLVSLTIESGTISLRGIALLGQKLGKQLVKLELPLEEVELFSKVPDIILPVGRPPQAAIRPAHMLRPGPNHITVPAVVAFLEMHKATFQKVSVYDLLLAGDAKEHVNILQWCEKNGVHGEIDDTPYLDPAWIQY